jgi:hypothetical protein
LRRSALPATVFEVDVKASSTGAPGLSSIFFAMALLAYMSASAVATPAGAGPSAVAVPGGAYAYEIRPGPDP